MDQFAIIVIAVLMFHFILNTNKLLNSLYKSFNIFRNTFPDALKTLHDADQRALGVLAVIAPTSVGGWWLLRFIIKGYGQFTTPELSRERACAIKVFRQSIVSFFGSIALLILTEFLR